MQESLEDVSQGKQGMPLGTPFLFKEELHRIFGNKTLRIEQR